MATKTKARKAAPVEEPEDEELEELAEDDEVVEGKGGKGKRAVDEVTFGVADLCALVKKKTGKEYSTRDMRTLLRKMAREKTPRITREVIPGNRSRYDWSGPKDPEVLAVLKAVGAGEIEAGRKAALDELKKRKAAKDAAEGTPKTKGKKGKAKPAPVAEDEDDDDDVDFEDDDE